MTTINRTIFLTLAPLLLAAPALAQTPPAQADAPKAETQPQTGQHGGQNGKQQGNRLGEMRDRLMAADVNKDDQWSREEWLTAGRRERGFEMMDADSNGQITREELRAGMERMQAMRSQN